MEKQMKDLSFDATRLSLNFRCGLVAARSLTGTTDHQKARDPTVPLAGGTSRG
jgi:hypothetical protein